MIIIRKYIILNWLKVFSICFCSLFGLLFLASFVDSMIRESVTLAESMTYLFFELPIWYRKVMPLAVIFSSLFLVEKLRRRNEFAAIYAMGFGAPSFIKTFSLLSLILFIFSAFNNFFLTPTFNKARSDWLIESGANFKAYKLPEVNNPNTFSGGSFWIKYQNYFIQFSSYDKKKKTVKNVSVYDVDPDLHQMKKIYKAKTLVRKGDEWHLESGHVLSQLEGEQFPEYTVYEKNVKEFNFDFDFLAWQEKQIFELNFIDLSKYLILLLNEGQKSKLIMTYLLILLNSCIKISLWILVPFFFVQSAMRRNDGFKKEIALCLGFLAFSEGAQGILKSIGEGGDLSPFVTVFLVDFLILLIFIFKYKKLGRY